MEQSDFDRLKDAVLLLEHPGWIARLTDLIGIPIEGIVEQLPPRARQAISNTTAKAIRKGLEAAVATMNDEDHAPSHKGWHKAAVTMSGAIGGFFGLAGLAVELPISTVIILRSIADIARGEGENLRDVESQLACIEVFALGGTNKVDDASESGYYVFRTAIAGTISEAAKYISEKGFVEEGSPILVRLIARIASRFDIVVSEKSVAHAVPIIGAVFGGTINVLFISHFQSMARGHFIVRNLERRYGQGAVREAYDRLARETNLSRQPKRTLSRRST